MGYVRGKGGVGGGFFGAWGGVFVPGGGDRLTQGICDRVFLWVGYWVSLAGERGTYVIGGIID